MAFGRKRGAQPRNRNAHKHGFYAGAFNKAGKNLLARAARIDPKELQNEIDLLRATLFELKDREPENVTVLQLCARQLVRTVAVNHGLNRGQQDDLNESLQHLITTLIPAGGT